MITCIVVGYFAATVERRHDRSLIDKPVVIGGQAWEDQPVYGFSQEVAVRGVEPGMTLRLAHILSPHSLFIPATPTSYLDASGEVVDVLTDFSHLIEPEDLWRPDYPEQQRTISSRCLPARYYLDLVDLAFLETIPLIQHIGRTVRGHTHLSPAIGLSKHKFVAQVAASLARPNSVWPVPIGQEAQFLANRSINFLPLDKKILHRLRLFGIRTLGQFAALPLLALREQFGPDIEPIHQLARGQPTPTNYYSPHLSIQPLHLEKREQVIHQFKTPIANKLIVTATLVKMARELATRLHKANLKGRHVRLSWETENGECYEHRLTFRQPTDDPEYIATSLDALLAKTRCTSGITTLSIVIADLTPPVPRQLSLFRQTTLTDQSQPTLQNLVAKHGRACFYQPALTERRHPLPERRFQLQALPL